MQRVRGVRETLTPGHVTLSEAAADLLGGDLPLYLRPKTEAKQRSPHGSIFDVFTFFLTSGDWTG